ncbi:Trehalase [Cucumispora dikerogammari]|nr:Trehalase [Cucumispora dikerogammari]
MFNYIIKNTVNRKLIKLNHSFMMPGKQSTEMYYWDTYFQIDTLLAFEFYEKIYCILENSVELINKLSYILNANRTYFNRSQPSVFGLNIDKIYNRLSYQKTLPEKNIKIKETCYDALEQEYNWWMKK